jgi:hypothetical protein
MSLEGEILECIRTDLDEETFNQAALELFQYQARINLVYRSYLRQTGVDVSSIIHWSEIPALPTAAFRQKRVACFPPVETVQIFETSGTTGEQAGKHEFSTLQPYTKSLLNGFTGAMPDVSQYHWVSLIPSHEERPTASLSFMVSSLAYHHARGSVDYLCNEHFDFEPEQVLEHIIKIALEGTPIFVLGTSFAYARLFESMLDSRVMTSLPPDSILFDTGGYKGRNKEYSRDQFHEMIGESLGIQPKQIWNEYGMTELSSQGYAQCDVGLHKFPAWARVIVRNPATGEICSKGEEGVIQIIDLANVGSVLAVSTLDAGVMHSGDRLELLGRIDSESLRGCSLHYE